MKKERVKDSKRKTPFVVRLFWVMVSILADVWHEVSFFVKTNMQNVGDILNIATPYIMWYVAIDLYDKRGKFAIGSEIFLPVFLLLLSAVLKRLAYACNSSRDRVPVYYKRFTAVDEEGEITVAEEDLQEMLIYLSDVEDYIVRKGYDSKWQR